MSGICRQVLVRGSRPGHSCGHWPWWSPAPVAGERERVVGNFGDPSWGSALGSHAGAWEYLDIQNSHD